jgi:hypothetical protein
VADCDKELAVEFASDRKPGRSFGVTDRPIDIEGRLADPKTYEDSLLRAFAKKSMRGMAYSEAESGVSYFATAAGRRALARTIARCVMDGQYQPWPVDLWYLETKGKRRAAHQSNFIDHVVGSALARMLTHNVCCYGLPGVYSYLPGKTNVGAVRDLARFVRAHRLAAGEKAGPLYVLQSDFEHYGDNLPVGHDAPLWPIVREVAALGSPNGEVGTHTWNLITGLSRPVVRDENGAEFVRLRGVAMGTPLVPVLSNLAAVQMDRAVLAVDGVFYARYNDDFLIAHPDVSAMHEADGRIDALLDTLGVKRKLRKERRTTLCGNGIGSQEDVAYLGRNRVDYLGLSISHTGTVTVGPHRQKRFVARIARRVDGASPALAPLPVAERARQLVATVNVMLDVKSPFAVAGLASLLDSSTDRGTLKDLDFRIVRKIVQAATRRPGVRGFRLLPPRLLYDEMGLQSLVRLRNLR